MIKLCIKIGQAESGAFFGYNIIFPYLCSGNLQKEGNEVVPFFFYPE